MLRDRATPVGLFTLAPQLALEFEPVRAQSHQHKVELSLLIYLAARSIAAGGTLTAVSG